MTEPQASSLTPQASGSAVARQVAAAEHALHQVQMCLPGPFIHDPKLQIWQLVVCLLYWCDQRGWNFEDVLEESWVLMAQQDEAYHAQHGQGAS